MNKKLFTYAAVLFFSGFFILACEEQTYEVPERDDTPFYNYFPLFDTVSYIYQGDSIIYDDFTNTVDTINYFLKDVAKGTYVDGGGRLNYKMHRYYRSNDEASWTPLFVWSAVLDENYAQKLIDNKRVARLSFPVKKDKSWNGNHFNASNTQNYTYKSVHSPFQNDYFNLDSTVLVEMLYDSTLIEKRSHFARYAKHIGLIYESGADIEWQVDYTRGYEYSFQLIEFIK
jgi:hypothetical protein